MSIVGPVAALGGVDRTGAGAFGAGDGPGLAAARGAAAGVAAPVMPGVAGSPGAPGADAGGSGQGFLGSLGDAFGRLNQQLVSADASMADFAAGGSSDLHTVMLEMQEASIGLKVGIQVRDRLLEAYQEIMRLQL